MSLENSRKEVLKNIRKSFEYSKNRGLENIRKV